MEDNKNMKSGEAAKYLGIHRITLAKLANNNKIKFFETPGGQKRFLKSELDKYLGVEVKE